MGHPPHMNVDTILSHTAQKANKAENIFSQIVEHILSARVNKGVRNIFPCPELC